MRRCSMKSKIRLLTTHVNRQLMNDFLICQLTTWENLSKWPRKKNSTTMMFSNWIERWFRGLVNFFVEIIEQQCFVDERVNVVVVERCEFCAFEGKELDETCMNWVKKRFYFDSLIKLIKKKRKSKWNDWWKRKKVANSIKKVWIK